MKNLDSIDAAGNGFPAAGVPFLGAEPVDSAIEDGYSSDKSYATVIENEDQQPIR